MARWRVDTIWKRAQHFGAVVADTEKQAIEVAIKQFEIQPARQNKIAVTKIADNDDD